MFGERPEIDRSSPLVPERLERLNRELKTEKCSDHVFATHGGHRIRVTVVRCEGPRRHRPNCRDFEARAQFAGRQFSAYGILPSHAFVRLTRKLSWAIDRYNFEIQMRGDDFLTA